jgi:hypothetical protein
MGHSPAQKGPPLNGTIDMALRIGAVSPCSTTLAGTTIPYAKRQGGIMFIREQRQQNPVADEVLALTAVVRPILLGTLYALKNEVVSEAGGYENVKLLMLPRLYKAGDGDCGICFEYAVHEAISRQDARVLERIEDAAELAISPDRRLLSHSCSDWRRPEHSS